MSANIEYLNDKDGNVILPKTVTKAITDENGNRLDKVLGQPNMDMVMLGWSVPIDCPIKNYVDDNRVFHQLVGRVDLGSLSWIKMTSSNYTYYTSSNISPLIKRTESQSVIANMFCSKYITTSQARWYTIPNSICYYYSDSSDTRSTVLIYDDNYTDETAFKNAMNGVYLYYELATEILIPVDGNEATTNQMLSDEWSVATTYAQGDFAIYKNKLWKSKVANNVGNIPAEGTYWEATNVGTIVSGISSELSEKVEKNEVKNFANFHKVYPVGTSRLDMMNDLANSLVDGQGATFSVMINGDNWLFGFITKYDSTLNGGLMVDASGTRYSFTSLSGIIQI